MRGPLAPAAVPVSRTRGQHFDDLVLDAVDELQAHWPELTDVEFAVEDIPPDLSSVPEFEPGWVIDRGVALGRLLRTRPQPAATSPVILIYRRPVETRAGDPDERGDLVFTVLAELAAELLGRDPEELD
jgi:predicted Zn-dependent protease with MMP-like domain